MKDNVIYKTDKYYITDSCYQPDVFDCMYLAKDNQGEHVMFCPDLKWLKSYVDKLNEKKKEETEQMRLFI